MSIRSRGVFWHDEPERAKAILLLEVSRRYYEHGMAQSEIAQELGYSRPTVSRLLAEAKRAGVVTITVTHPLERLAMLERMIAGRYGIANVRVTPTAFGGTGLDSVGTALARFLERSLEPGMSIGLTTGRIHQAAVDRIRRHNDSGVQIVQLVGQSGVKGRVADSHRLCRKVAEAVDGTAITFDAPLLAPTPVAAEQLCHTPQVSRALRLGGSVDMAVIGIGASFRHPADVFSDMLSSQVVRTLHKKGAVGHVLGRFIDPRGRAIQNPLNDLTIGITLSQLRRIPVVLGVAAGSQKAAAVAAALRGGLVNALILDAEAAQAVAYLSERAAAPTEPLWNLDLPER